MKEFAGTLNERVQFERLADDRSLWGGSAGNWVPVADCWAGVRRSGQRGSADVADTLHGARRFVVTMRRGPGISLGMRMLWRGRWMHVVGIDDLSRTSLSVTVEEIGDVDE